MTVRVDFYFDVVCPYAYLAHTQIEGACRRVNAELAWHPILLGGLFRAIGAGDGTMAAMPPEKEAMNLKDMFRWAEHWGVPLSMPCGHPNRTVLAMRAIIASGDVPRAAKAIFLRYWRDGLDVSDEDVICDALDAAGFDGGAIIDLTEKPATKDALRANTDAAAAAGVFGVPTFVVHGPAKREPVLIWGQDRIHFVESACQ